MTIHEVTSTDVLQRCANCATDHRIAFTDLQVGFGRDQQLDENMIPFPACTVCQTVEFLIRSPADEPEYRAQGSFAHLHRLLVDHLHAELARAGRVMPALHRDGRINPALSRPVPAATLSRWFPAGLKAEWPSAPTTGGGIG